MLVTRTRTCPAPGAGVGTSTTRNTSGGPNWSTMICFMSVCDSRWHPPGPRGSARRRLTRHSVLWCFFLFLLAALALGFALLGVADDLEDAAEGVAFIGFLLVVGVFFLAA